MTLNQLRTFLAVAETGSVRAAAQDLVVTQAAVSASLAALQKSLGVALLEPDGRGLRLTAAGQAYAGYVRRVLGLLDEAGRAAAAAADPERGRAAHRGGDHGGRADPARAAQRLPDPVSRSWGSGWRRGTGTGSGACSTGIRWTWCSAAAPSRAGTSRCSPSGRTSSSWWPRPAWPPPRTRGDRRPAALAGPPGLAAARARSGTRAATDALLAELDIAPLTLMVGSNGAIRESASVGLGVTLISRDAVAAELADGRLVALPVPGTPLHRDWYLVALRAAPARPACPHGRPRRLPSPHVLARRRLARPAATRHARHRPDSFKE